MISNNFKYVGAIAGSTQLFVATSSVDISCGDSVSVIGRNDDNSLVVDAWFPEPSTAASLKNWGEKPPYVFAQVSEQDSEPDDHDTESQGLRTQRK